MPMHTLSADSLSPYFDSRYDWRPRQDECCGKRQNAENWGNSADGTLDICRT